MKKISYICNRCRKELGDTGSRIIPIFFDTETESTLENITVPESDVHFCTDCTKAIMEELTKLPDKKEQGGVGQQRKSQRNGYVWMPGKSWLCIVQDGAMRRLRMK